MPHFVVTYVHRDPTGWAHHLDAHLRWLVERVESGQLRASGPTTHTETAPGRPDQAWERTALLVFAAADEETLHKIVATDPYLVEGQVQEMTITRWDPIFGVFGEESSRAGVSDAQLFEHLAELAR
ncbi:MULTISPECIES: YciI family protein [Streptomyces]|uniref:YciI family protein n=1 Tax=Streptomyces lycopersici TaxID=2974589 RepID=UPI0021D0FCFA|nr:YciI family protein [Streptomyces sp. NEAU-383]